MARLAQGLFVSLLLAAGVMAAVAAADFPSKPIRVIVPYAAGGIVDAVARAVGSQLAETMGQPVVVENRPGGSAIIGMMACVKAPADGYTLCMPGTDAVSYNAYLFKNLPYDSASDLIPVICLALSNSMLAAKASARFNSFKEMIAYAKSNPGALNWATWGAASLPDVYLQWIKHQTGVDIAAIAYKG
ncbi:MAG: tripartite tricarboxylate transporter substrate binding protein, partial [Betaproteobacteria bacterium]|nr:tripartite tricarboxylate transporter substrate binding protein [Betaproteobacteria bacterium]